MEMAVQSAVTTSGFLSPCQPVALCGKSIPIGFQAANLVTRRLQFTTLGIQCRLLLSQPVARASEALALFACLPFALLQGAMGVRELLIELLYLRPQIRGLLLFPAQSPAWSSSISPALVLADASWIWPSCRPDALRYQSSALS